jgi:hypothetical protein
MFFPHFFIKFLEEFFAIFFKNFFTKIFIRVLGLGLGLALHRRIIERYITAPPRPAATSGVVVALRLSLIKGHTTELHSFPSATATQTSISTFIMADDNDD